MKYPSADSLNSATDHSYSYNKIVQMEGHFLNVLQWELLQYTVLDYLHLFLAQGCFFESDTIIGRPSTSKGQKITQEQVVNMRRYAEFFTDFTIQESDLID